MNNKWEELQIGLVHHKAKAVHRTQGRKTEKIPFNRWNVIGNVNLTG